MNISICDTFGTFPSIGYVSFCCESLSGKLAAFFRIHLSWIVYHSEVILHFTHFSFIHQNVCYIYRRLFCIWALLAIQPTVTQQLQCHIDETKLKFTTKLLSRWRHLRRIQPIEKRWRKKIIEDFFFLWYIMPLYFCIPADAK